MSLSDGIIVWVVLSMIFMVIDYVATPTKLKIITNAILLAAVCTCVITFAAVVVLDIRV